MPISPVGTPTTQSASITPTAQAPSTSNAGETSPSAPKSDAFATQTPKTTATQPGTRPADGLKAFSELTPKQQALLGEAGPSRYAALSSKERGAFITLTTRMDQLGLDTSGLKLKPQPQGVQEDRLMFDSKPVAPLERLKAQVQAAVTRGDFKADKPEDKLHPGMSDSGARQWVTKESMQLGFGRDGAFVDVDRFGVKTDVVGIFGHLGEVLTPGKTDMTKVAKSLHIDLASRLPPAGQ